MPCGIIIDVFCCPVSEMTGTWMWYFCPSMTAFVRKTYIHPQGKYQIMEPDGDPFTDFNSIDVALIPGMAFTQDGKRLGRGKGYYDRLLAQMPSVYKIGICFPFQLLKDIPTDENDILMDEVIY